jgi:putative ATP-binding cassette transporter
MDEATAALDPASQDRLMGLVSERLPEATLVSVAHRVELEAFHTRKLVLEYGDEGARLVGDEALQPAISAAVPASRNHIRPARRPRPVQDSASAGFTPLRAPEVADDFPKYGTAPALAPSA